MARLRKLLLALLCAAIVLTPALAEARAGGSARFGGSMGYSSSGSLGSRTYNYNGGQPVQRSLTPNSPSTSPSYNGYNGGYGRYGGFASNHPFLTGIFGGFLGSWLGGLLFPHWGYGYGGYGGYGFGGVIGSIFSWLFIIFAISMIFRLFRRGAGFSMPSFGGMGYGGPQPDYGSGGFGAPTRDRPLQVGQSDYAAFEAILKAVQGAWSAGDLATLRHYTTPEMLSYFAEDLANNQSQGVENHVENVELINGDVREAWDEGNLQYATALLHWRAIDYTVRTDRRRGEPGSLVEGDPQRPSEAQELWTFARSPGGHWLLSAIQQV